MYDIFGYILALMTAERKSKRIDARMPAGIVARLDFVTRNIDSDTVKNRSAALLAAVEAWLPGQERRLEELGVIPKKTRP